MFGPQSWFRLILFCSLLLSSLTYSQSFTPGNLALLRVGDGTQVLTNSGNSLFVDQYTTGGALVSSVPVPDTGTGGLLLSGASGSEGGLTRSLDRSMLILAGYNANRGSVSGSLSSQSGTLVPRAVADVDGFSTYHLAGVSSTLYSSNNIRGAASDGTNNFWTAGPGGTFYWNPPQAPVELQAAGGNIRQVKIINRALYFSTQAGTAGIYTFQGGGLPETAANPVLVLATGANSQPAGFALNSALTIAYVADQRPTAGGIQKWTNNGSAWVLAYSLPTGGGAFDVAVDFSGSNPVLYATTAEASANRLISITDTGPLSIVKALANAGANRIFRGLDFAPDLRPEILESPQSQTVTNGSDVTFEVVAQSRFTLTYQWQKDGADIAGANSPTLSLQSVSSTDQAAYRVVVTDTYGSATSAAANLTVNQVLVAPTITSQPASQNAPLGGTATFTVTVSGTPPYRYQWQFNGHDLQGQTNSTLTLQNVGPADQGNYLVTVSNPVSSTNSQPATLTVLSPPPSFIGYSVPGQFYSQNFDSLPDPGLSSVNANNPVTIAGVTYGLADPFDFGFPILPNSVNPNTGTGLGGLGLSNSMPGWYALGDIAPKFGASAGDQSTGGAISFGPTNGVNSANRALGLLATSSTGPTAFGLELINETATTLNQITVHFTSELWRQAAVPKRLSVSYFVDNSATADFSTNLTALLSNLDVVFAPLATATNPVPVDGTAPANQISLGVTNQLIADWLPGGALWLTWRMADATGKGQGLAIDDLLFSASASQGTSAPQLAIQLSGTDVIVSWPEAFSGFALQANSDLGQPAAWAPLGQTVVTSNGLNSVTIPIGGASQFYRLKK